MTSSFLYKALLASLTPAVGPLAAHGIALSIVLSLAAAGVAF